MSLWEREGGIERGRVCKGVIHVCVCTSLCMAAVLFGVFANMFIVM